MIEKFKKMPWSVKFAVAFLASLIVLMCVMAPPVAAGVALMCVTYWAIWHVIVYFDNGVEE